MAKHITKSVIEDIAYELKRVGLITHAFQTGTLDEDSEYHIKNEFPVDLADPEEVLDWVIQNIYEAFAKHDPTFNGDRYTEQTQYKVTD